ncbi:DUF2827 domain-containing protein [Pandoraea sp. NPDC090278]|uniref:DUF2827 domain-containing protein n=1 Tax=Pandoraea sp. NPDC090278 TaxID=3364391 RepID=UPI00383B7DC6
MTVGISLFARDGQSIWENGIHQNVAFLAMLLKASDRIGPVYFLNGGDATSLPEGLELNDLQVPLVAPEQVTHELDVVIQMGAQLPLAWLRRMKARGTKLIACFVGNIYADLCEFPMFGKASGHLFNGSPFDEAWVLPKSQKIDASILRTILRVPVFTVPHLWSPYFLKRRCQALVGQGLHFGYRPRAGRWRLSIAEPNISVVKSCQYPMLVADAFYRRHPDAVEKLSVVNTSSVREHPTFLYFANRLDLVQHHKAAFADRVDLPSLLAQHTDAVISHQWENPQNYLYYDTLYGGYPLIHNSTMLGDAGYFYPAFDAAAGATALHEAWCHHDARHEDYNARSRAVLHNVSIANPANVATITQRLVSCAEGEETGYE